MPKKHYFIIASLFLLLCITTLLSAGIGALHIPLGNILSIIAVPFGLSDYHFEPIQEAVFWSIRLPRLVAAILVGGSLSLAGACLQGLFRNPLADPGLIGISSGASLAASVVIVLGLHVGLFGSYFLSLIAFIGAATVAFVVYHISKVGGKVVMATMLLAGIAVAALSEAGRGILTLISSESELRDMTFWLLGSLGGANWSNMAALAPFASLPIIFVPRLGKQLNAFALGEQDADYIGVNTSRLKLQIILLTTMAVGASVSIAGMIGFVGLVVPHLLRLIVGPDHRILLPASILSGAILLMASDLLCRTVLAPVEIPVGIITSAIGVPLFLSILIQGKKKQKLLL